MKDRAMAAGVAAALGGVAWLAWRVAKLEKPLPLSISMGTGDRFEKGYITSLDRVMQQVSEMCAASDAEEEGEPLLSDKIRDAVRTGLTDQTQHLGIEIHIEPCQERPGKSR